MAFRSQCRCCYAHCQHYWISCWMPLELSLRKPNLHFTVKLLQTYPWSYINPMSKFVIFKLDQITSILETPIFCMLLWWFSFVNSKNNTSIEAIVQVQMNHINIIDSSWWSFWCCWQTTIGEFTHRSYCWNNTCNSRRAPCCCLPTIEGIKGGSRTILKLFCSMLNERKQKNSRTKLLEDGYESIGRG